jgi:hypothetical protein
VNVARLVSAMHGMVENLRDFTPLDCTPLAASLRRLGGDHESLRLASKTQPPGMRP